MCFKLKIRVKFYEKRRLNALAKSISPCQPAQIVQADMSRNFSPSFNSSLVKG